MQSKLLRLNLCSDIPAEQGSAMRFHLNRIKKAHWAFKSISIIFGVLVFLSLALQKEQPIQAVSLTRAPLHGAHHSNDFSGPYDSERVASLAMAVSAPEYFVLPDHSGIAIETGWLAILGDGFGDAIDETTSMTPNLYWNISDEPVSILLGNHKSVTLECGGLILVFNHDNACGDLAQHTPKIIPEGSGTVNITCGDGYYACCSRGPPMVAVCVANAITRNCTAGGLGATSCSITFADP